VKRTKETVGWIAAAAGFCLTGLLVVQIFLVRRNLEWKSQAFRQNAAGALASVAEKLEARETLKRIWTVSFANKGDEAYYALLSDDKKKQTLVALSGDFIPKVQADCGDVVLTLSLAQRVRLVVVEPMGKADTTVLDEIRPAGRSRIPVTQLAAGGIGPGRQNWIKLFLDDIQYDLTPRDGCIVRILAHPTIDQSRAALMEKVLEQYFIVNPVPIEQRIDAAGLKSVVEETLRERGLTGDCAYGVIPAGRNEVVLASEDRWKERILGSVFRTRLFPHDMTVAAGDLAFFFPGGEGSILSRLGAPAVVAVLFILASAACLFLILRAAAGQKRYAAATADFVNNMTHEFKTPISTISLASETLGEAPVRADEKCQTKYRDMIRSECRRMQDQIRKILETAALEKGDLDLNFSRVDAHEAIRQAAEAFVLTVESRGGAITTRFEAEDAVIDADPLHFQNVVRNLLDNAVKYTRRPPEIVVATKTAGDKLQVAVTDNGIGLGPDARKRVFEKYYRVPTGNVHDVKGFGIGLSYVKLIVKAHGGSIGVRSEEGRGSTFEIEMPFRRSAPGRKRQGRAS